MWMRSLSLALAVAILCGPTGRTAASSEPARPSGVQLRVVDPAVVQALESQGARRVADYGSFVVVESDTGVAEPFLATHNVEQLEEPHKILLSAGPLDTTLSAAPMALPMQAESGRALRLVQFVGPIVPAWFEALTATGVQVVTYIPHNAYLVYGDPQSLANLQQFAGISDFVRWEGPYLPSYKVLPAAAGAQPQAQPHGGMEQEALYTVQLLDDPQANPITLALIEARRIGPVRSSYRIRQYLNVVVSLPAASFAELAERPDVVFIDRFQIPVPSDEVQCLIAAGFVSGNLPAGSDYLEWLASVGFSQSQFDASGFLVEVADSGIDNGTINPNHFSLYTGGMRPGTSRVVYSRLEGTPELGPSIIGCDGHGTLNAHILAGYGDPSGFPNRDASGFRYGLGVAPFVRLGSSVVFNPIFTFPPHPDTMSRAFHDGARISSNSWGSLFQTSYNETSQIYDILVRDAQPPGSARAQPGNQEVVVLFSAGNSGPFSQSITPPGTAKNVITVGAAENVRFMDGPDNCGVDDDDANSANDITWFQSRGPTLDGRLKPDLVAAGTHVTGGVVQQFAYGPLGAADPCFNGSQICGGRPPSRFFPAGQQLYTSSSGTSHSCPAVAGGAALLRQFFLNQGRPAPSPAMTKAVLMNSARYLTGAGANDTLPSPAQGMGGLNLQAAFARGTSVPTVFRDQLLEDTFTATGQTRVFQGVIADPTQPVRITLVWTDAPGSPLGAVQRNDLDLVVDAGGASYWGNIFAGPTSIPGGAGDRKNNVESVFLPAGLSGAVTVTVTAANINSDGVPENGQPLDQDFALVGFNLLSPGLPFITPVGVTLVEESCLPANGLPDSTETLTVAVGLTNVGAGDVHGVSAELLATERLVPLSNVADYGTLPAGGGGVARLFTLRVEAGCGESLWLPVRLTGQTGPLGTLQVSLPVGNPQSAYGELFDSEAPPALSTGWTTLASAEGSELWQSTGADFDTAPSAMVGLTSSVRSSSSLISPPILIHSASAELSFRHRYDLQGGHGGQLKIAVDDGSPADVLSSGCQFLDGPYRGIVSDVIGGGWGWTGTSGGWITTTLRLPVAMAGRTVRLHWVLGTDGVAQGNWYVDTLSISDRGQCCEHPTVTQIEGPSVQSASSGPVLYTAWFSEAVVGFDAPEDVEIHATGSAGADSIRISGSGAGPYTIELDQLTGQGTLTLSIRAHACADADGNLNPASEPSGSLFVDSLPIECTLTRLDPDPTDGSQVRFAIALSKPVDDLTLEDLGMTLAVPRAVITSLQGGGSEYQLDVQNVVGDGTICIEIPAGVCFDEHGNTNLAAGPLCYTVVQVKPNTRFNYQLVATLVPHDDEESVLPASHPNLRIGQPFFLELWARQEHRTDSGLTCVYADVTYDPDRLRLVSQDADIRFAEPLFLGAGHSVPGLIDELGGCTLERPGESSDALSSGWVRVAIVTMTARAASCPYPGCSGFTTLIGLGSADSESAAYAEGRIDPQGILYGGLSLSFGPGLRADLDLDGDVDSDDVLAFGPCAAGPAIPMLANCEPMDLDGDGDVDATDFGLLQRCYSGRDVPADPDCDS